MGNAIEIFIEIFLLMYADDIVILGDTVLELQRKIRVLEKFCEEWGMEVNLTKTKVIVFRNGGVMSKSEKFLYRGEKVKTVTYYRYLGLIFSSRNLWSKALSTLAAQAEKALSTVRRMIWKLGHPNPEVAFKIFDGKITPVLCYGAELWGSESRHQIEQVHIGFCKFILGLGQSAHSSAALGECGRLPLYIQYEKRYVKYRFKLLKSPENSFLYLSYKIQLQLDKLHKKGWVTNLKQLLFSNGFGHVWISQEVGDEALFLREFTLRLQDIARQNWRADLESSAKLSTYSEFKSLLNPEKYLKVVKNYFIRKQLAKLRTSNHDLMIEKGRYQGIEVANRTCEQ